jgi:BirA family biotin operon repressor/biotin-[acetyl-CoA-carboxylase] ligase
VVTAVPGAALSIELLRDHLDTETVGRHIYLFGQVVSTNATLRRLAAAGAEEGTVVLAEEQTGGRGRGESAWFSPPGVNVYASVLLRPALAPRQVPTFALIASLALCEAAWREGATAAIKWPNDVLLGGRKVAGSLVEYATRGDRVEHVILGVGANLNVDRRTLDAGLGARAPGAVALGEVTGREVDRNVFAATFLNRLEAWYRAWQARGTEAVLAAWRERHAPGACV